MILSTYMFTSMSAAMGKLMLCKWQYSVAFNIKGELVAPSKTTLKRNVWRLSVGSLISENHKNHVKSLSLVCKLTCRNVFSRSVEMAILWDLKRKMIEHKSFMKLPNNLEAWCILWVVTTAVIHYSNKSCGGIFFHSMMWNVMAVDCGWWWLYLFKETLLCLFTQYVVISDEKLRSRVSLLISDCVLLPKLVGSNGWFGFHGNLALYVPSGRWVMCESMYDWIGELAY